MMPSSIRQSIRTVLQSVLRIDDRILWCEVVARGRHDYEVHVVPQWNMSLAVVEHFWRGRDAIRRHAELSWLLRGDGWRPVASQDPAPPCLTSAWTTS